MSRSKRVRKHRCSCERCVLERRKTHKAPLLTNQRLAEIASVCKPPQLWFDDVPSRRPW